MKKSFLLLLVCATLASCTKEEFATSVVCRADVVDAVSGDPNVGTATLIRTNAKLLTNIKINGLVPGHAYTIWWVIWNNPENCTVPNQCDAPDFDIPDEVQVEVMYAAGAVVGANGKGKFSAKLYENDDSGSINDFFGLPGYGGMHDALTCEVHVVLRSHGPVIPDMLDEQLGSYEGGCSVFLPDFTEYPDEVGECADIMFAIFSPDCNSGHPR